MIRWRLGVGSQDRGSATVEIAILMPAFILLIVLAVVQGRAALAQAAIESAAYDAARTASLAGNAGDAGSQATIAARTTLDEQGITCVSVQVELDLSQYSLPVGTPASVRATVHCTLSYADLDKIPGVPTTVELTANFTSPLDQYRSRG